MKLSYLPVHIFLEFETDVKPDVYPTFALRSVLGYNLRRMNCISRQNKCDRCMFNKTCAYAYIFETILPNENNISPGRNRAAHPFVFTQNMPLDGWEKTINKFDFTITLLGKAIEYLPYIYASFVLAGKNGLFRSRTNYKIVKVEAGGKNILLGENKIDTNVSPETLNIQCINTDVGEEDSHSGGKVALTGEVFVELKSPLRFKINGNHAHDFSSDDFFRCLWRRAKTVFELYGDVNAEEKAAKLLSDSDPQKISITEKNLQWKEYKHYSARQKDLMTLGGVTGTFKLQGEFSSLQMALLEAGQIINAGKNVGFGFGQMKILFFQRQDFP